jgi:NAD(P)H-dependent flavin oxidoreductase YrpB (nitropropane dioxygenase family)
MAASTREGRRNETIAGAGQTAGGIRDVRPVAEIIASLVQEAEAALRPAPGFVR